MFFISYLSVMESGIYKLGWPNGKYYIGQASNLGRRKREHLSRMRNREHDNHLVQQAFEELGEPVFEVVERCCEAQLNEKEQALLDCHFGDANCCNLIQTYSRTGLIFRHDDETKKRIGEKSKLKVFTPEYRQSLRQGQLRRIAEEGPRRGYKMSAEAKQKMSEAGKGKPKSAEHRAKIGAAQSGAKRPNAIKIQNTQTGHVYDCMKDMCKELGLDYPHTRYLLRFDKHPIYKKVVQPANVRAIAVNSAGPVGGKIV